MFLQNLQDALYNYVIERLDNEEAICTFIPAYIDFKEQNEYQNWLGDIEKFVGRK